MKMVRPKFTRWGVAGIVGAAIIAHSILVTSRYAMDIVVGGDSLDSVIVAHAVHNGVVRWWYDPLSALIAQTSGGLPGHFLSVGLNVVLLAVATAVLLVSGGIDTRRAVSAGVAAAGLMLLTIGLDTAVVSGLFWGLSFLLLLRLFERYPGSPAGIAFVLAAPAFFTLLVTSSVPFPDYSAGAHVVPDDGIPGVISPLVQRYPAIPIVDRSLTKLWYGTFGLVLFAACLALSKACRRGDEESRRWLAIAFACSIALVLDLLGEKYALVMPLASLNRLIPHAGEFSVSPFLTGLSALAFCIGAARSNAPLTVVISLLVAASAPRLFRSDDPRRDFLRQRTAMFELLESAPELLAHHGSVIASPSLYLLRHRGLETLGRRGPFSPVELDLVSGPEAVFDGDPRTRWSSPQKKPSSFQVRFDPAVRADGMELSPGVFPSDFPRSIRIERCTQCDADSRSGCTTEYDDASWQGPVRFSPGGFPYYGAQSDMELVFSKTIDTNCLVVSQRGGVPRFDWSVAEVTLVTLDRPES